MCVYFTHDGSALRADTNTHTHTHTHVHICTRICALWTVSFIPSCADIPACIHTYSYAHGHTLKLNVMRVALSSKLWINSDMVVDNDGLHGAVERCGERNLNAGNYDVTITGFQREGGAYMSATYQ